MHSTFLLFASEQREALPARFLFAFSLCCIEKRGRADDLAVWTPYDPKKAYEIGGAFIPLFSLFFFFSLRALEAESRNEEHGSTPSADLAARNSCDDFTLLTLPLPFFFFLLFFFPPVFLDAEGIAK